ncbi:MAG: hypothetical protein K1X74_16130, partial [Pirellulales bacterium]|nr:hypothetical protein [Pirellulales bacterium]
PGAAPPASAPPVSPAPPPPVASAPGPLPAPPANPTATVTGGLPSTQPAELNRWSQDLMGWLGIQGRTDLAQRAQ